MSATLGVVWMNFPSFLEGLSLRPVEIAELIGALEDFPSFLEGLSLRQRVGAVIGFH